MCSIVCIVNCENCIEHVMHALQQMEYRGYDSVGIGCVSGDDFYVLKAVGRVSRLYDVLSKNLYFSENSDIFFSHAGPTEYSSTEDKYYAPSEMELPKGSGFPEHPYALIGHTRWATHGEVSAYNAHPHYNDRVCVVHNGTIDNYHELRKKTRRILRTGTDTEVIAHLIADEMDSMDCPHPLRAVQSVIEKLEGNFAFVALFKEDKDNRSIVIGVSRGAPLCVGSNGGGIFIASDVKALSDVCEQVQYLNYSDILCVENDRYYFTHADSTRITVSTAEYNVDLGAFPNFMLKEIMESPFVVSDTMRENIDVRIPDGPIHIIGCGTSYYAGMVARYVFERFKKVSVKVDIASEIRYSNLLINGTALLISQSGETADLIGALDVLKNANKYLIVNARHSTLERLVDNCIYTHSGTEVGVASTKNFIAQVALLSFLGAGSDLDMLQQINESTRAISFVLKNKIYSECALSLSMARAIIVIGKGHLYPVALEGALKIKELSYIPSDGISSGELKHGPLAIIDEHVWTIVLAPSNELWEKNMIALEQIKSRKGKIILISDREYDNVDYFIRMPYASYIQHPLIYAPVLHMLAYHTALCLELDVDKPRNLAKSLTVE